MFAASTSAILPHIPSEILYEILLKLPVKSLVRFSTVSKSWFSMISESGFVQEHKRRAAVNGVESWMVTLSIYDHLDRNTSVCRIPQTSSMGIDDSSHLICPIEGDLRRLRASCDGLWLVEAANFVVTKIYRSHAKSKNYPRPIVSHDTEKSIYLWNPSTRTHRKLPDSLLPTTGIEFGYGLGYDSVADDYKVLKIAREESSPIPTELYSLKSDSWKTISPPPPGIKRQQRCEYVNGSLHWIPTSGNTIVTFDLSTEKCGEIMLPAKSLDPDWKYVEVVVLKGKLCASVDNSKLNPLRFGYAFWVMEEYGVEKSWTNVLNIEYGFSPAFDYPYGKLKPVHFYDNGDVLFNTINVGLCMYKNEDARFERLVARDGSTLFGGFSYVESLVSPLPQHVITSRHEINELSLNVDFQACLN